MLIILGVVVICIISIFAISNIDKISQTAKSDSRSTDKTSMEY